MFWEIRGTRRYLYRSHRRGDTFEREYLGTGRQAEHLYREYRLRREAEHKLQAKLQHQLDAAQPAHIMLADFTTWSDLLNRATLVAAGYYLHHRHEWRHRRGTNQRQEANP